MRPTIRWLGDANGRLELLDQTRLPEAETVLEIATLAELIDAIRCLAVRGAPALGVAAAYGMVLGSGELARGGESFERAVELSAARLRAARPTAVNLGAAIDRMCAVAREHPTAAALLVAARALHAEDEQLCQALASQGWDLVPEGGTVLTHCNTGRLATAGDGTALGVLFEAARRGRRFAVLADETRPLLQGARLTTLELSRAGIPVELIVDAAAAGLIARGAVDLVVVGADRIARNGDVANKVGTYPVALAAHAHDIPFWVVAPHTTLDLETSRGADIPIEDREPREVLEYAGRRIAPVGVGARNPAFDITPAHLITGLVTDLGRVSPVCSDGIKTLFASCRRSLHEHGLQQDQTRADGLRRSRVEEERRETGEPGEGVDQADP